MLNLYIFWIFCSFWETGMCWSTSIINQCGWRISVASDFISLWLVLVNYNRILHFVFLPWRVIFITFQPFLWSVIKIKQSGIRNSEEVSHILNTNYITITCVVYFLNQIPNNQYIFNVIFLIVELASLILGTDYTSWAVLAQCNKNSADSPSPRYLSTR